MSRALISLTVLLLMTGWSLGGCSTAPKFESDRKELIADADLTISRFKRADPDLERFFDESAGYAVFPTVGKGAVGVGGAYGRGVVYQEGAPVGFCDLSQGTIGFQLGGQSYSEIIFFAEQINLSNFKGGHFTFAAQASAVAATAGASADADYSAGVAVFTMAKGGLMYEASIGGQKFSYKPMREQTGAEGTEAQDPWTPE